MDARSSYSIYSYVLTVISELIRLVSTHAEILFKRSKMLSGPG